MNKYESGLRGAYYGALQQPRDVVAALYASALSDLTLDEALNMAREKSLSGSQGQAMQENPGWFSGGQIAGNVASSILPAKWATSGIAAAAPVLNKAPLIGQMLSGTANAVGTGSGIAGTLGRGAVEGAVSTGISDADLGSGAAGGAIGNGIFGLGGKLVKPLANNVGSAAKQGYENVLKGIGIDDLTLGQSTGNRAFELVDSVLGALPFTANKERNRAEGQLRKFTSAAMEKAGLVGDDFSPAVRGEAEKHFGSQYKGLMAGKDIPVDDGLISSVADIYANQVSKLPSTTKPVVESYIRDIVQAGGSLTGESYQNARSMLTTQARSMSQSDPFTANALRGIRNALDDAAERALPDAEKGAWRELNNRYRNYKTLVKAASRPSQDSLEGIISPASLLNSVETANKSKSQAGYGDLYELARAGRSSLVDNVPNSGTAQRQFAQQLITGAGVGGLAGAGSLASGSSPEDAAKLAIGGVGASYALPKLIQTAINSGAGKQYLTEGIPYLNRINTGLGGIVGGQLNAPEYYDPNNDPEIRALLDSYDPSQDEEITKLLLQARGR